MASVAPKLEVENTQNLPLVYQLMTSGEGESNNNRIDPPPFPKENINLWGRGMVILEGIVL